MGVIIRDRPDYVPGETPAVTPVVTPVESEPVIREQEYTPEGRPIYSPDAPPPSTSTTFDESYTPTYFENFNNLANYYNGIQASKSDFIPPDWMQTDKINFAFETLRAANSDTDWTNWGALPVGDPMRDFLRTITEPPINFQEPQTLSNPDSVSYLFGVRQPLYDPVASPATQKKLDQPELGYYPSQLPQPGPIVSTQVDPEKWAKQPGWTKIATGIIGNPILSQMTNMLPFMVSTAIGAGIGFVMGGPGGAIIGGAAINIARLAGTGFVLGAMQHPETFKRINDTLTPLLGAEKAAEVAQSTAELSQKVLYGLDALAIVTEKAIGTAWQGVDASSKGQLDQFMDELPAAWKASEMTYEAFTTTEVGKGVQNIPNYIETFIDSVAGGVKDEKWVTDVGQAIDWETGEIIHLDAYGVSALSQIKSEILAGGDAQTIMGYWQEQFGVGGVIADLGFQILLDPLNVFPEVTRAGIGKVADVTKNPYLKTAVIQTGKARPKGGPVQVFRQYQANLWSRYVMPDVAGKEGWVQPEYSEYSSFQRHIGGVDAEGNAVKLDPNRKTKLTINPIGLWNHLTHMTNESKFDTMSSSMADYLQHLGVRSKTEAAFKVEVERLFKLRPAEGAVIAKELGYGPIWSLWQQSLKNGSGDLQKILNSYTDTATYRQTLSVISQVIGDTEGEVVARFLENPSVTQDTLINALAADPQTQALISEQTPAEFKKFAKYFRTSTWNDTLLNVRIDDHVRTTANAARKAIFKVDDPSYMKSALTMGKTVQALLLFSLNPAWMVNNIVNNEATALISRNFSFMTGSQVKKAMTEYGVAPARVMDQFTNMDLVPDDVEMAIRDDAKATRGAKGLGVQEIMKKFIDWTPIVRTSRASEKSGGLRTYWHAFDNYMKSFWVRDKGIGRLDPAVEGWINDTEGLGPAWMNAFYAAMEDSKTPDQIRGVLKERVGFAMLERNINVFSKDAASRMGMRLDEFNMFMAASGAYDMINQRINEGGNIDEAIDLTVTEMEEHIEDMFNSSLLNRSIEIPNRLELEGTKEVIDVFSSLSFGGNVSAVETHLAYHELFMDMDSISDPDAKQAMYRQKSGVIRRNNLRQQKKAQATYVGVVKNLGLIDNLDVNNVSLFSVAVENVLNDSIESKKVYWAEADRLRNEFYEAPWIKDDAARRDAFNKMNQKEFILYMEHQDVEFDQTRKLYNQIETMWLDQMSEMPDQKKAAASLVMENYVRMETSIADARKNMMRSIRAWELNQTEFIHPDYVAFFVDAGEPGDKVSRREVWKKFQTKFILPLHMETTKHFFDHEYNLHAAISGFPPVTPPTTPPAGPPPEGPPPTAPPEAPPPEGAPPADAVPTPPTTPPTAPPAAPPEAKTYDTNFLSRMTTAEEAAISILQDGVSEGIINNINSDKGFYAKYASPEMLSVLRERVAEFEGIITRVDPLAAGEFDPVTPEKLIDVRRVEGAVSALMQQANYEIRQAYEASIGVRLSVAGTKLAAVGIQRSISTTSEFERMLLAGDLKQYESRFHSDDPVEARDLRMGVMQETWGFNQQDASFFNKVIENFAVMLEKRHGIAFDETMSSFQMFNFQGTLPEHLRKVVRQEKGHAFAQYVHSTATEIIAAVNEVKPDTFVHEMAHAFMHLLPPSNTEFITDTLIEAKFADITGLDDVAATKVISEAFANTALRYFESGTAPNSTFKHEFEHFRKSLSQIMEAHKTSPAREAHYLGRDWASTDPTVFSEIDNFYRHILEDRPSDHSVENWIGRELERQRDIPDYPKLSENDLYTAHDYSVRDAYDRGWLVSDENITYYHLKDRASAKSIDDGVVGDNLDMLWNFEKMDRSNLPSFPSDSAGWLEYSKPVHPRMKYSDGNLKVFYPSKVKVEYGQVNSYTNNPESVDTDNNYPLYVGLEKPLDLDYEYDLSEIPAIRAISPFIDAEVNRTRTTKVSGRRIHEILSYYGTPKEGNDKLMQAGYDGIVYKDGRGESTVPFGNKKVRSVFNKGDFSRDKTAILYNKPDRYADSTDNYQTPIWEANIETAAEVMPGMDVSKVLDWMDKERISPLTIQVSGLDTWLAKQIGKVTGAQIQEYMNSQSVAVSEVHLGDLATTEARAATKFKDRWYNVNRSLGDYQAALEGGFESLTQYLAAGHEVGFIPAEMGAFEYHQYLLSQQYDMLNDVELSAYFGPKNQRRINLVSRENGTVNGAVVSDRYNRGYDPILHIESMDAGVNLAALELDTKYSLAEIENVLGRSKVIQDKLAQTKAKTMTGREVHELFLSDWEANSIRRLVRYAIDTNYRGISFVGENAYADSLAANMGTEVVADNVYADMPRTVHDVYVDGRMEETFTDRQKAEDYQALQEGAGYIDVDIAEREMHVSGSPEQMAYVFRITDDMFQQAAGIGKIDFQFKYNQNYLNFGKPSKPDGTSNVASIRKRNVLTSHPGQKSKVFTNGVYSRVILADMIETFNSVHDPFGGGGLVGVVNAVGIKNSRNPNGLAHSLNDYDPALFQLHRMLQFSGSGKIDPKNVAKPLSLTARTEALRDWHLRLRTAFPADVPPAAMASYASGVWNKMYDNVQNGRRIYDWSVREGGHPKVGPTVPGTRITVPLPQTFGVDNVTGELPRYQQLNDIGFAQLMSGSPLSDRQTYQTVTDDRGTSWKNGDVAKSYQDVLDSITQRGIDMNRPGRETIVTSIDATKDIDQVMKLPDFNTATPNANSKQTAFVVLDPPYPWADPSVKDVNYGLLTKAAQAEIRKQGLFTEEGLFVDDRVLDTKVDPLQYNLNFIRTDVKRLVDSGVPFVFTNPANKQVVAELKKLGGINFIFYELYTGKKYRAEMLAYPSYMKQEVAERADRTARNTENGWERWMGDPIHDTSLKMMEELWSGDNPLIAKTPRLAENTIGKVVQNPSDGFDSGYNWDNTQSDAAPPAGPDLTPNMNGRYQNRILPRPIPFGTKETVGRMWANRAVFMDGKLVALQPGDLSSQDLTFKFHDGREGQILGYDFMGNYVVDHGEGNLKAYNPNPDSPDVVGQAAGNTYDASAGGFPYGEILSDGFEFATLPGLESIRNSYHQNRGALDFTGDLADMPPDLKDKFATYLDTTADSQSNTVAAAERYGLMHRDQVLLNYRDRTNLDTAISTGLPYAFWWLHQMVEWSLRIMDRPALASHFTKIAKLGDKNREENKDLPSRLEGKWNIPAAWAPAYTGQQMWVDPVGKLFPLFEIMRPFEQMLTQDSRKQTDAERIINKMYYTDNSIGLDEAKLALSTQSGALWEQAMAQATAESDTNMLDWIGMFSSPAMWLTYPIKLINGKANELNPLPISRNIQGLATATGIDALRLLDVEAHVRNNANVSEFGQWGEWYVDRQMTSLAAENPQNVEEIEQDFLNRSGPWWDEAYSRVQFEMMIRQPFMGSIYATRQALEGNASISDAMGSMLFGWLPSGMVSPAELHQRGLYDNYQAAWTDYNAGNKEAIDEFFDTNPEYKIQAALYKKPDERLHQYLINDIWEAWYRLPSGTKGEATTALGPEFEDNFINSATRDYKGISNSTLALWSNELGGRVPATYKPEDGDLVNLPPEGVNITYQRYLKEQNEKFGYISDVSQAYYQADDAMKGWIRDNTDIIKYWAWKDKQMADNPDLMPYMISEKSRLAGVDPGTAQLYYNYKVTFAEDYPDYWDDLFAWIDNDKKNPSADLKAAWDFENETMSQYPQLIPLTETTAEGVEKQMKYSKVTPEQVIMQNEFTPPMRETLFQHFNFGDDIGAGAMQELLRVYALTDPGVPFSKWVEGLETFYQ